MKTPLGIAIFGMAAILVVGFLVVVFSAMDQSDAGGLESYARGEMRRFTQIDDAPPQPEAVYVDENGDEVRLSDYRGQVILVNFWATWCGPCVMLSKVLEQLAAELGDNVSFVKIDTDEEVELASYFQIQGLPTLMVLGKDKGSKVLRAEGLLPADQIKQMIQDRASLFHTQLMATST